MTGVLRRARAAVLLASAALALSACRSRDGAEPPEVAVTPRPIEDVLAEHRDSLLSVPGVVGAAIGLCDGEPCIRVWFADSASLANQRVAPTLDGHPVRAEVAGRLRARPDTSAD